MRIRYLLLIAWVLVPYGLSAKEGDEEGEKAGKEIEQVKIGNLAVPGPQQPAPLLGVGQNIIDKDCLQVAVFPNWFIGIEKNLSEVIPAGLYGIRDDLSLLLFWPIAAHFKAGTQRSSGPEDFGIQFEYAFHAKKTETYTNQCTFLGAVLLPIGDDTKQPITGFGSPSFFLGGTASHVGTEWYCYASWQAVLRTRNGDTKPADSFIYQGGFGKNIAYSPDEWTLMWMIELSGTFTQDEQINGVFDNHSEGNTVLLGPSLFFSTKNFIAQLGVAPVVQERICEDTFKTHVFLGLTLVWTFY